MTREIKLALILGSALVLVVGVLISDHLSGARNARIAQVESDLGAPPAAANVITAPPPEPRRNDGWAMNLGPATARAAEPAPIAPQGALVDPSAPTSLPNEPTASLLPPAPSDSAPQLSPSDQDKVLMEMARKEGVDLGYVEPPATNPFLAPTTNPAPQAQPAGNPAQATEIVVREGDTLWGLAETHLGSGAAFNKLLEANKDRIASDNDLRVGTRLRLPTSALKSQDASTSKPATKPSSELAKNDKPAKTDSKTSPRTYTIKKGDTLGSIASAQLGSAKRWKEIQDANPGLKPTDLRVGQSIKLPPK